MENIQNIPIVCIVEHFSYIGLRGLHVEIVYISFTLYHYYSW